MANYNKSINFSIKDSLNSGDPNKIVSGVEIDNEFNAISSSSSTKIDKISSFTPNNLASVSSTGSVEDSGTSADRLAPPGSVMAFAGDFAPMGWLTCDGRDVGRSTYPDLFTAIGTIYGEGDSSTTFGLPDLRGEFVRGADIGRGVDYGRLLGTHQLDQMQRITGGTGSDSMLFGNNALGKNTGVGAFSLDEDAGTQGRQSSVDTGQSYERLSFDSANSPNARVSDTTDGETRPRNLALLYIIKV